MTAGCFLDTNVLLYAVSTTPAEASKRQLARYLLTEDDWTLSVQVLQEFYAQPPGPRGLIAFQLMPQWR